MYRMDNKLTVLPGAVAPEGAGEEGEFVDYAPLSLAQLKGACRAMPGEGAARGRREGGAAGAARGRRPACAVSRYIREQQGRAPLPPRLTTRHNPHPTT
jgi:hypothetical protein